MAFLVTCEHGSNQVPDWLASAFAPSQDAGGLPLEPECDLGSLDAAQHLARQLRCSLVAAPYSPSVVDVNRSRGQRGLFSTVTRNAPRQVRNRILSEIHEPYRKDVEAAVSKLMKKDDLLIHLSVHSFATFEPSQADVDREQRVHNARRTDLGLLYDTSRAYEVALCLDWYEELFATLPMLRVRRNYPHRGISESLIRSFRQRYSPDRYIGIELQLNRAWCVRDVPVRRKVFTGIAKSLLRLCDLSKQEAA